MLSSLFHALAHAALCKTFTISDTETMFTPQAFIFHGCLYLFYFGWLSTSIGAKIYLMPMHSWLLRMRYLPGSNIFCYSVCKFALSRGIFPNSIQVCRYASFHRPFLVILCVNTGSVKLAKILTKVSGEWHEIYLLSNSNLSVQI